MDSIIGWEHALALGAVQGLTEFLPISSSGHLVLGQALLGFRRPELAFDVLLHVGTLAAVLVLYGGDLWRIARAWLRSLAGRAGGEDLASARMGWLLLLGSVPAAVVGVGLDKFIEPLFAAPRVAGYALFVTGALLFYSAGRPAGKIAEAQMDWKQALLIGLLQALAIVPGISRSGATIAAALSLGIERDQAVRFSFLLSVPAIAGAFLLKAGTLAETGAAAWGPYLLGTAAAAGVGALALGWLIRLVRGGNLRGFAYYCWAAGALALALL